MKKLIFTCILLFLFLPLKISFAANTPGAPAGMVRMSFTEETCVNTAQVTKDLLNLELAGYRWMGGDSTCLRQSQFTTLYAEKLKGFGDRALLQPEYILPQNREIKIVSTKIEDHEEVQVTVKIAYIAKKNSANRKPAGEVAVRDELIYKINYGRSRELRGCASLIQAPEHFVMRESCRRN